MKYGFRFVTREEWGLLRGLFRSAFWFKVVGSAIAGHRAARSSPRSRPLA